MGAGAGSFLSKLEEEALLRRAYSDWVDWGELEGKRIGSNHVWSRAVVRLISNISSVCPLCPSALWGGADRLRQRGETEGARQP